jgi:hypothetical protein
VGRKQERAAGQAVGKANGAKDGTPKLRHTAGNQGIHGPRRDGYVGKKDTNTVTYGNRATDDAISNASIDTNQNHPKTNIPNHQYPTLPPTHAVTTDCRTTGG